MPKSFSARMFVALIVISGLLLFGNAMLNSKSMPTVCFVVFLLVTCLAVRLNIKLPGLTGTISLFALFCVTIIDNDRGLSMCRMWRME
ncbi:MAG: hypothetical protein LAO78_04030 [Acidobacteriia bacterium]|nr:hypothetical protein [Terriglobia bacterium]